MKKTLASLLTMLMLVVGFGCGSKEPEVDTAPLKSAIEQYLEKNNMELMVYKFKAAAVQDANATATCSLKYSSGAGPAVQWKFEFSKEGDGWKVTKHIQ